MNYSQTNAVTNPLSPLKTPSTSDIILEDDSDNEEPEILEKATSQKKGRKTEKEGERNVEKRKKNTNHHEQKAKKIKKGKDDKKQDEEMTLTEEEQEQEKQKQDDEVRRKEAEQKRKEKQEQEEIRRKEEEHKKQETQKQEEENRRKEEEQKKQEKQKQDEELRLKQAEEKRKEKQKQDEDEEIRFQGEEQRKQEVEEKEKHNEESKRRELEASEDQGEDCITLNDNITASEWARKLLRKGGMPLFPAGGREWNQEEVIPLITITAIVSLPPKKMTPEQTYFNWEYASIALELNSGKQLEFSKEELLLKYHFLALPGTKTQTGSEENTMATKSRFYLYQALAYIIKSDKEDASTVQTLNMLETAVKKRDNSTDEVIKRIDDLGIPLRLGEDN